MTDRKREKAMGNKEKRKGRRKRERKSNHNAKKD